MARMSAFQTENEVQEKENLRGYAENKLGLGLSMVSREFQEGIVCAGTQKMTLD